MIDNEENSVKSKCDEGKFSFKTNVALTAPERRQTIENTPEFFIQIVTLWMILNGTLLL